MLYRPVGRVFAIGVQAGDPGTQIASGHWIRVMMMPWDHRESGWIRDGSGGCRYCQSEAAVLYIHIITREYVHLVARNGAHWLEDCCGFRARPTAAGIGSGTRADLNFT